MLPIRSLLGVPVTRNDTQQLRKAIGKEVLARGNTLKVSISETNVPTDTPPLATIYAKNPAGIISDPHAYLTPDRAHELFEDHGKRRYNWQTKSIDEAYQIASLDTYLRKRYLSDGSKEPYLRLQDINLLLKKVGQTEA